MKKEEFMNLGVEEALKTSSQNIGGPFGACIVKDGKVVCVASNSVLRDNDPTAHAEVNAIRKACKNLKTYDLTGCEIYATGEPCPMCLGAIIWSNMKKVYYGCTSKDIEKIAFRDEFIYEFIRGNCKDKNVLDIEQLDRENCLRLLEEYSKNNKTIYWFLMVF